MAQPLLVAQMAVDAAEGNADGGAGDDEQDGPGQELEADVTSGGGRPRPADPEPRRPGQPSVDVIYVNWHTIQVFKSHGHRAA